MPEKHHYRGRLSETSLAEMLATVDRFRVAGVVTARHGEVRKDVYLRDGYVVHATSTDRRDSLGEYLLRSGRLSEDALRDLSRKMRASQRRLGVLLIERRLLSPAEVYESIQAHVEEIVWSLFNWRQGEVSFAVGEDEWEEVVRIQLPMRLVILEGIRRAPDARPLLSRLGKRDTVLEPCFRWEDLIESGLNADETGLLLRVDARKTLYQLCSDGPLTPANNAKLLYAFQVLDLVRRRPPKSDARPERSGPVKIKLDTSGDAYSSG